MMKKRGLPDRDPHPNAHGKGHEHHEHHGHQEHGSHAGPKAGAGHAAPASHAGHHAAMVADFRRRFFVCAALTVPILALDPMLRHIFGLGHVGRFAGDTYVLWGLSSAVFFYGGWPFLTGLAQELRRRLPGMMTLIGLAIGVAYLYSSAVVFGLRGSPFFWELATLIDVMLLGHWIEMRSVMGASRALESLVELLPAEAHRLRADGSLEEVPLAELRAGDRVLVKPGEKVPVDGDVVEGRTSIDEALLTGESAPVEKGEGDRVIGGSANGEAAVTIEVRKTGRETYLAQVLDMVRRAQESRSRTQDLANRAALWLTVIAITVGAGTLAAWLLIGGRDFAFAIERAVTVMVITCPHALGLAVPLVVAVSTAISARNGLLIRDRTAFERARGVQAMLFDKTGTLTEGRFGVTDVIALDRHDEAAILRQAASLESRSEHPIARGIVEAALARGLQLGTPEDFRAIPGKGAQGLLDGRALKVVSPGYLKEHGLKVSSLPAEQAAAEGKTVVYLLEEERPVGAVALADIIRPESRAALRTLKEMGIQVMMITGDAKPVARWVAKELELDEFFAEVLPDQKAAKVREVQARGLVVAMAGDGVNDAPALAQADVGIAIGAGTEVAIQSADVVLVRSDPRDAAAVVRLARATYRKMVQNLLWATGYNVVAIPLAAGVLHRQGVLLTPAAGAALMALSTVIVALNARRLRLDREPAVGERRAPPSSSAHPAHPAQA